MKIARIFGMCLLSALLAVGLVTGYNAIADFQTITSGPIYNAGTAQFFRDEIGRAHV